MKNTAKYFLPPVALLVSFLSSAQEVDSLRSLFQKDREDTVKVIHASALCWEYWGSGRYDTAMIYGNIAIELARKLDYQSGLATAYNNTGLVYFSRGYYPEAQDYFFNALKIHERLLAEALTGKDSARADRYKNEMARNIGNIGLVYNSQEEFSKALDYYIKALGLFEEIGNKGKICAALGNIGNVYKSMGDNPRALEFFYKALRIGEESGNKNAIGRISGNIGNAYFEQRKYEKARDHFSAALAIAREIGDKNRIPIWLANIGLVYKAQGEMGRAEDYLLQAEALYREIDDLFGLMDVSQSLSQVYERTKRFEKALSYHKISMTLKDSLFNEEKNKEITRKEMNYEFDKREAAARAEADKQAAVAAADKERQQAVLILVSCVLLLSLVFAGFIFRSLRTTRRQKQLIEQQKHLVEEKQKEILDSIHYARRIQTALLPTDVYMAKTFMRLKEPDPKGESSFFILYRPKDIVSGDFYYVQAHGSAAGKNELIYLATADCTGHGVPGAFMSMLGVSALNEAIIEKNISMPHEILNDVRHSIITSLNPEGSEEESKDGMDCVLCAYDFENMKLTFSAANNPLWLIRKGELKEFKPDKIPVGKYGDVLKPFSLQTVDLQKGDILYTFTDGYADQFGGPKGKKFKYKQLQEKLLENHSLPLAEQKKNLGTIFENWRGELEQVDDVLIIALKI